MDTEHQYVMRSEVSGSGNPVVLVPGGLTGWLSWKPHAEQLSANCRVIRVQLLSVDLGLRNEPLPTGYSVGFEAVALEKALDRLGVRQADFAAWSYGGEIALSYALSNPDRVRTLTLIEPPVIWVLRSRGGLSRELLEEQRQIRSLGPEDVSESQLEWFTHFAGFVPIGVDPKKLPQWPIWVEHRRSLRTGDAAFQHQDSIERVRRFDKPVLLFKGEGSSGFLHQIIDILGEEFPDASVKVLPGGHALQMASIREFMEILNRFLLEGQVR
ncbi:MAG: alpha/beta hydrolase [Thaumarchaeota archaeon]|nr:alpha/beta hydrolase [Nitrososphaerota archaeon]